jgi:hypothetical protein
MRCAVSSYQCLTSYINVFISGRTSNVSYYVVLHVLLLLTSTSTIKVELALGRNYCSVFTTKLSQRIGIALSSGATDRQTGRSIRATTDRSTHGKTDDRRTLLRHHLSSSVRAFTNSRYKYKYKYESYESNNLYRTLIFGIH